MNSRRRLPTESGATPQNVAPLLINKSEKVLIVGINRAITLREGEDFKRQLEARLPKDCRVIVLSDVSAAILIESIPTE